MKKKKIMRTTRKRRQVVNSTKAIIDGIEFKSGLEATMYKLLKVAGIKCTYEGESFQTFKPFKLKQECYERTRKTSEQMVDRPSVTGVKYTPDFIGEDNKWFIECKGRPNESFSIRWKLFKKAVSEWESPPLIFKPTNKKDCEQVINILKSKGYAAN